MVARDRVKTMVPRARSTLDSHPEVKQRKATQVFPTNTKSQAKSFAAYDWTIRSSKISPARRVEPHISP